MVSKEVIVTTRTVKTERLYASRDQSVGAKLDEMLKKADENGQQITGINIKPAYKPD